MSKLLIDEYPLMVLPQLAKNIGLNESIILQQIHYWVDLFKKSQNQHHFQQGKWWVWNTGTEWVENFPFWSECTIRRGLDSLRKPYTPKDDKDTKIERKPLVIVGRFNKKGYDQTLWYRIDYEEIARIEAILSKCESGIKQDDKMDLVKMSKPIPETTTETNNNTAQAQVLPGLKAYPPKDIQTEYVEVEVTEQAREILCPECGEKQEWPRPARLRKKKECLVCSSCGVFWKIVVAYDCGESDAYKVRLPKQQWTLVIDDTIPDIQNWLYCDELEAREFIANWQEDPKLVVTKLQWAVTQDWLKRQKHKIVARVNAAYETTKKREVLESQPKKPKVIKVRLT